MFGYVRNTHTCTSIHLHITFYTIARLAGVFLSQRKENIANDLVFVVGVILGDVNKNKSTIKTVLNGHGSFCGLS